MFPQLSSFLFVLLSIVIGYYGLLAFLFRKKLVAFFGKSDSVTPVAVTNLSTDFPHQLIDRPGIITEETSVVTAPADEAMDGVMQVVDDEETHLLKAAEIVVEKVQDVVSHIASSPPNPEEVFTKIRAVVSPYTLFHGTDYYDAINSFIALTVERDCALQLTPSELQALWN